MNAKKVRDAFALRGCLAAARERASSRSDGMSAFEPLSSGLPLPGPRGARGRKRPLEINRDQYRAVNPRFTCDEMSSVDIAALNVELRCPICLRLMRDPVATECLHRFCKDCIEKCQRQAQKQCPSCRKPIATRRSLRPDPSMKRLIGKLYPDLDAFEADEEAEMLASNRKMAETHLANIEKVLERQRAHVAAAREHEPPAVEYEATSSSRAARGASGRGTGAGASRGRNDAIRAADESRHQRSVEQAVLEQLQHAAAEESDAFDDEDEDEDEEDEEVEDEESGEGDDDDESNSGDGDQIGTQDYPNLDYENWAFEGRGGRSKGAVTGGVMTGGASSARTGGRSGVNVVHRKSSLPSPSSQSEAQRAAIEAAQARLQLLPRPSEVGFRLQPHPDHRGRVERLARDFICVSQNATVDHVHKFLCHKLRPQHAQPPPAEHLGANIPRHFEVHVAVPSLDQPSANGQKLLTKLRAEMTLIEVLTTFRVEKHNLDLFYSLFEGVVTSAESSTRAPSWAPDDGASLSPATRSDERS